MKKHTSSYNRKDTKKMMQKKRKLSVSAKKQRKDLLQKQQHRDMREQEAVRRANARKEAHARTAQNFKSGIFATGKIDSAFLIVVLLLLGIGLVMMFSASYPSAYSKYEGDSFHYIKRQLVFAIVGVIAMYFISKIDYRIWSKLAIPLYIVSVLFLILALVQPRTTDFDETYKRWITLGPISFQPSEIAKLSIIVLFAHLFAKNQFQMHRVSVSVVLPLSLLAVVAILVIFERHLSATLIIVSIGFILMFMAGLKLRYIFGAGAAAMLGMAAVFATGALSHATLRLQNWLNPWNDPLVGGYQTIQSLYAIGSGGLLGKGFGQSQQKYLWLPEPQNDFIFAIVVEELGFIGGVVILAMFAFLVWRGLTIASKSDNIFGTLLATGLVVQVGLQTILNIFVVTNTIPNTGISLPFFSYGGTSLMILLAEMGIVLSISRQSSLSKL